MAAAQSAALRKVGTPQGRVLACASRGDSQESATENKPPQRLPEGCHGARVKRCGKSAPAPRATGVARQTPPGARPCRERASRPQTLPGRPQRWMAIHGAGDSAPGQNPAYRPTPRHIRNGLSTVSCGGQRRHDAQSSALGARRFRFVSDRRRFASIRRRCEPRVGLVAVRMRLARPAESIRR